MALNIGDNFDYKGQKPNFARDSFDTLAEMKAFAETSIDDGHISFCKEDSNHYVYKSTNEEDDTTGKWKKVELKDTTYEEVSDEKSGLATTTMSKFFNLYGSVLEDFSYTLGANKINNSTDLKEVFGRNSREITHFIGSNINNILCFPILVSNDMRYGTISTDYIKSYNKVVGTEYLAPNPYTVGLIGTMGNIVLGTIDVNRCVADRDDDIPTVFPYIPIFADSLIKDNAYSGNNEYGLISKTIFNKIINVVENEGYNTVTTVVSIPVDKKLVIVTVSESATLSLVDGIADGKEIHIIINNSGSSAITVTLPNEDTMTINASSYAEVNVIYAGGTYYWKHE